MRPGGPLAVSAAWTAWSVGTCTLTEAFVATRVRSGGTVTDRFAYSPGCPGRLLMDSWKGSPCTARVCPGNMAAPPEIDLVLPTSFDEGTVEDKDRLASRRGDGRGTCGPAVAAP